MPCCIRRPRKFKADRPFVYLLAAREFPIFLGIYQGSEFAVPDESDSDTDQMKPVNVGVKEQLAK